MTMENISFPLFFLFLSFFSLCYSTTKYAKYIEVKGEVRGSFFAMQGKCSLEYCYVHR